MYKLSVLKLGDHLNIGKLLLCIVSKLNQSFESKVFYPKITFYYFFNMFILTSTNLLFNISVKNKNIQIQNLFLSLFYTKG